MFWTNFYSQLNGIFDHRYLYKIAQLKQLKIAVFRSTCKELYVKHVVIVTNFAITQLG